MGLEKVDAAHTQALSLSQSQLGEQRLGKHNHAEKGKNWVVQRGEGTS